MSINITSTIKNISENSITQEKAIAKKEKDKITYKTTDYNYTIIINSPNEIILNRKNNNMECTMYFKSNKKTTASYIIENEYNLDFDLKTTLLNIKDNLINIHYTITDTQTNYEYIIEMSE